MIYNQLVWYWDKDMAYTNQKVSPTNINYTNKDFSSLKADLIQYTKAYFPDTYKDFNETSPGMMLIELASYVGDVLSYYIDYNYKESLLTTATERKNVIRLAEFLGYKTTPITPSVVKLSVTTEIDAIDGWDLERKAEIAMDALRVPAGDADVTKLSGGEKRRVALCQLLLSAPDMLLLDEPTNHLDAESVAWLQKFLHDFPGTVVTITHDRYFLDEVAGWILELDRGAGIPYEGNYSGWLEQKQKRLEQEGRADDARVKSLSRELDWVRAAPKARQAKSKARINAYEKLLAEGQQKQVDTARISIPAGPRLGDIVINANAISKAFGDRLLIDDLSFRLPPGGIVGVIGPNGAGKTTLFRMITGEESVDKGDFVVGDTVKLGYVDQSRDALDDKKTVWEVISGGLDEIELGKRTMASRAYVGQFNFRGADQQKQVGQLSGGERNRVHLARMLKSGANLLLLDEPTNDLDVDTLRALEEALEEFAGCAVVVSHDRWFLDRIATHILAFEGDSHVEWFEGNYEAYEADKKRRLGAEADRPTRIKYKPLSR